MRQPCFLNCNSVKKKVFVQHHAPVDKMFFLLRVTDRKKLNYSVLCFELVYARHSEDCFIFASPKGAVYHF